MIHKLSTDEIETAVCEVKAWTNHIMHGHPVYNYLIKDSDLYFQIYPYKCDCGNCGCKGMMPMLRFVTNTGAVEIPIACLKMSDMATNSDTAARRAEAMVAAARNLDAMKNICLELSQSQIVLCEGDHGFSCS